MLYWSKEKRKFIICCLILYLICLSYYGVRAICGIPSSMPATWDQISPGSDPAEYAFHAYEIVSSKSFLGWKEQLHRGGFMPYYLASLWFILGSNVRLWILAHLFIVSILPIPIFLWVYAKTKSLIPSVLSALATIFDTEIAGLAITFYPVSLATPLMALLVWVMQFEKSQRNLLRIISGIVLLMCLLLVRNNALFLIPVVSFLSFKSFRPKDIVYSILLFLVISVMYFGIIGVRNKLVTDKWIFLPTQGPFNAIIGNEIPLHTDLSNIGPSDPESFAMFQDGLSRIQNWSNNPKRTFHPYPNWFYPEANPYLCKALYKSFKENTKHHLIILSKKFYKFWFDREFWLYTIYLLIGMTGLLMSKKGNLLLAPVLFLTMWCLPLVLVLFFQRHRIPMTPLIYSIFIMGVYSFIKERMFHK